MYFSAEPLFSLGEFQVSRRTPLAKQWARRLNPHISASYMSYREQIWNCTITCE